MAGTLLRPGNAEKLQIKYDLAAEVMLRNRILSETIFRIVDYFNATGRIMQPQTQRNSFFSKILAKWYKKRAEMKLKMQNLS